MKIKKLVYTALLCGILCVASPIALPIGPVPITLTTLIIYLITVFCDIRISLISVVLYILIGSLGLPVFSSYGAGIGHLLGPTGGFIIGYIPLTLSASLLIKYKLSYSLSILAGTVMLYLTGITWYIMSTDSSLKAAATIVIPFVICDAVKILVATLIHHKIRHIIKQF